MIDTFVTTSPVMAGEAGLPEGNRAQEHRARGMPRPGMPGNLAGQSCRAAARHADRGGGVCCGRAPYIQVKMAVTRMGTATVSTMPLNTAMMP